jgi:hypothetical protein
MKHQEEAVKQVVSISLGSSDKDYAFNTEFLGQNLPSDAWEPMVIWKKRPNSCCDGQGGGCHRAGPDQVSLWDRPTLLEQNQTS